MDEVIVGSQSECTRALISRWRRRDDEDVGFGQGEDGDDEQDSTISRSERMEKRFKRHVVSAPNTDSDLTGCYLSLPLSAQDSLLPTSSD